MSARHQISGFREEVLRVQPDCNPFSQPARLEIIRKQAVSSPVFGTDGFFVISCHKEPGSLYRKEIAVSESWAIVRARKGCPLSDEEWLSALHIKDGTADLREFKVWPGFCSYDLVSIDTMLLEKIYIPDEVQEFHSECFHGEEKLKQVIFGPSSRLTSLAEKCFYCCSKLEEIYVPNTVQRIGARCFSGCESLRRVVFGISSCLQEIEDDAFTLCSWGGWYWDRGGCPFEEIYIPDSVEILGCGCFENCAIRRVTFGPSPRLKSIGSSCFAFSSLWKFNLPESVTEIYGGAFNGCAIGGSIYVGGGFSVVGSLLLRDNGRFCCSSVDHISEIDVPDTVVEICDGCFSGCGNLRKVRFGDASRLERLGAEAFTDGDLSEDSWDFVCDGCPIEEIRVPDSVREIGDRCFAGCRELASVTFGASSRLERIGSEAFADVRAEMYEYEEDVETGCLFEEIVLPDSVEVIEDRCFLGCTRLSKITVGAGSRLKSIGHDCFDYTGVDKKDIDRLKALAANAGTV